ncbi:MAG: YbhB/YbcL family Raf kinase inhibitor-like protein [Planctomycetia bacterium]|jgi:Raf kinase inhibitor-like YbhB/YbcL family protein|nr:YbhB/YbcL family Raf kinase inhibitor-like protein [Planctomycetia bacterium]
MKRMARLIFTVSSGIFFWTFLACGWLMYCHSSGAASARPPMTLTSPAFQNHSVMPRRFTADGRNISPPLAWRHVPKHTVSLALVMVDPDAPGPQLFMHWIVINIPPTVHTLAENVPHTKRLKNMPSVRQGKNSFGKTGYDGPAPPPGPPHHYRIILYALSRKLLFAPDCLPCLHHAMAGYILAQAVLHVRYGRSAGR